MKTITLGTHGNQPFVIAQQGVSRNHATITIDDNNRWTLTDLNSSNGTFVRDDDGHLRRVSQVEIDEMTFISLGPYNAMGCGFYARQVLGQDNFLPEMQFIHGIDEEADRKLEKAEKTIRYMRFINPAVTLLLVILTLEPVGIFNPHDGFMVFRVGMLVSSFALALYDGQGIKRRIVKWRDRFHQCPNPQCSHYLSITDVRQMMCSRCRGIVKPNQQ